MAHCANAMATVDYKKCLLKGGQFHSGATESTIFLYDTMSVTRNGDKGTTQRKSLDKLHFSLWVKTKNTFQVLSSKLVMYVLYKGTPIMTTSGVYDDKELDDAEHERIKNLHDSRDYCS